MKLMDKAKQAALAAAVKTGLGYLEKDPEVNIPKLMELVDKFVPDGWYEAQRNAIRNAIQNKDSNWYKLILRIYELDPGVREAFFTNFIINASLKGSALQEETAEENNCNVPWAILLDPTSACNLHCTGCWAAEYGNKLNLTYDEIDNSIENLWSVLFTTGYLTQTGMTEDGAYRLVIPNREIREVFKLQIQEWFKKSIFSNTEQLTAFWKAFEEGNTDGVEMYLNRIMSNSISVFDIKTGEGKKEISYHNLLVGILTGNADWLVKSNVEAGEGFADIIVETEDPNAGIIVELKYTKNYDEMEQACKAALDQINDRRYQEYLLNDGRKDITLYGIAFCKKRCKAMVSGNCSR